MNSLHRQAAGYTDNGEPFVEHHPVEDLEPMSLPADELRDTRLRYLELITDWASQMHRALSDNSEHTSFAVRFYGPAFALALPCLEGISMSEIASRFNVTRACISKAAVRFAEAHGLPASRYLKSEESRCSYSSARIQQVKSSHNGNGHAATG